MAQESRRELRDAAGILSLHGREKLDVAYVERWVPVEVVTR
jgi:hypothetical protein